MFHQCHCRQSFWCMGHQTIAGLYFPRSGSDAYLWHLFIIIIKGKVPKFDLFHPWLLPFARLPGHLWHLIVQDVVTINKKYQDPISSVFRPHFRYIKRESFDCGKRIPLWHCYTLTPRRWKLPSVTWYHIRFSPSKDGTGSWSFIAQDKWTDRFFVLCISHEYSCFLLDSIGDISSTNPIVFRLQWTTTTSTISDHKHSGCKDHMLYMQDFVISNQTNPRSVVMVLRHRIRHLLLLLLIPIGIYDDYYWIITYVQAWMAWIAFHWLKVKSHLNATALFQVFVDYDIAFLPLLFSRQSIFRFCFLLPQDDCKLPPDCGHCLNVSNMAVVK